MADQGVTSPSSTHTGSNSSDLGSEEEKTNTQNVSKNPTQSPEYVREIQLGFAVTEESTQFLKSPFFPSKVGGKPAWLDPVHILENSQIQCPQCNLPMTFLLQIYAPLDPRDQDPGASDATYHRTLFLFCCKKGSCHSSSKLCYLLFRCQIPCVNDYYQDMSQEVEETEEQVWKEDTLKKFEQKFGHYTCEICGMKAGSRCGSCKIVRYCGKEHQLEDWSLGHDIECKALRNGEQLSSTSLSKRKSLHLFKEFEIETEEEVDEVDDDEEEEEGDSLEDKKTLLDMYEKKTTGRDVPELFEEEEEDDEEKKIFLQFQKKVKNNPDQILRYSRGNENALLWLSLQNQPESIPPCDNCGGKRIFEFEILPQLLYYLGVHKNNALESLDWGALVGYTCQNSCSPPQGKAYITEFIWVHQIPSIPETKNEVDKEVSDENDDVK